MERYIRTQSSPPSSPVSSSRPGPGPGPATQSPLSSPHHSQPQPSPHPQQEARQPPPRQPPQPHHHHHQQLGGEMRNGASTSSLDRVITPAKVKLSPARPDTPLFSLDGRPPVQRLHQFSPGQRWEPPARFGRRSLRAACSARQPEAGGDSHRTSSSDRSDWPASHQIFISPGLSDSRGETPNNSGRNSPVCWQPPSLATKNRNNSDQEEQSKPRGFGAFNSIYDVILGGNYFSSNDWPLRKTRWPRKYQDSRKLSRFSHLDSQVGQYFWGNFPQNDPNFAGRRPRGSRMFRPPAGPALCAALPGHPPPLSHLLCQGNSSPLISLPPLNQPVQVVKEYERAVIFRLGRLRSGGAKVCITMDCSDNITHYMAPRVREYSSWCLALTLTRNWTSELLVLTSRRR